MIKHFLLIVIDCLRADHVSTYGYHRETTPTLDELAESGICWTNAHSVSSWTKPSVSSLLTGLYPREHGAVRGLKRSKLRDRATSDVLSDRAMTLPQYLSDAGFRCGGFVNNVQLDDHSGLNRGFSHYTANAGKADALITSFEQWLTEAPFEPWFAYLHFLEAHWPYKPRRRHVQLFGGNRDTNPFAELSARDFGRLRKSLHRSESSLTQQEVDDIRVLYDASVRRLDGKLRGILKMLRRFDLDTDTAIFVTSDHGEEFLDHGSIGHGHTLFQELIRVPLIARVPSAPSGVRIEYPVSHVDLAPTVLKLADLESSLLGRDLTNPASLRSPVVSELVIRNRTTRTIRIDDWKLHEVTVVDPAQDDESDAAPEANPLSNRRAFLALYDLSNDALERNNLHDTEAGRTVEYRLAASLEAWKDRYPPLDASPPREVEVEECVVQRLRDLGYID